MISLLRRTLLLSLCLLCLSLPAMAQEATPPNDTSATSPTNPRQRSPRRVDRGRALARQLDLTSEQLGRLREIRQQSTLKRTALAARLRQAQRALDTAIFADGVDEALIEEHVRRVAELQREGVRLRAFTELEIRRLLTPQQLQAMRDMRERERTRRLNRRHARRGRAARPDTPRPPN